MEQIDKNEVRIVCPPGMEIDKENSTFECIKFKPIHKRWREDENANVKGYYITCGGNISHQHHGKNLQENYGLHATEKQAKSALAMARISQIMANDERFGGIVTDKEWNDSTTKSVIKRLNNKIIGSTNDALYHFLAFHTEEQRDLFMEENMDLIKDYYMLD